MRQKQKGFTLIEFVISMTMMSILSVSFISFLNPMMDIMVRQSYVQGPAIEGRLATMRMAREIAQLKDNTSISTATAGTFSFTDVNNQSITYQISSGNLVRNNIIMAKGATSLAFTYYDTNNATLGTPTLSPETNINRIAFSLTMSAVGKTITTRGQVQPRNLFD